MQNRKDEGTGGGRYGTENKTFRSYTCVFFCVEKRGESGGGGGGEGV